MLQYNGKALLCKICLEQSMSQCIGNYYGEAKLPQMKVFRYNIDVIDTQDSV